jgi:hypothetical protein
MIRNLTVLTSLFCGSLALANDYSNDYSSASAKAIKDNKKLLVLVGDAPELTHGGALVVRVKSLEGYGNGSVVLSYPEDGQLWFERTLDQRDALDEVNASRASHGLRPFIRDEGLSVAARSAADFRAANLMEGHTSNDFSFVPSGSSATSAGCAAWGPSWGWGSCCTHDNYTYAGAAWAMGRDGRRYMHLYVR